MLPMHPSSWFNTSLSVGFQDRFWKYVRLSIFPTILSREEDWSDHMQNHQAESPLYVWSDVWSADVHLLIKSMVIHDTECPYWDQVSLNNKPNLIHVHLVNCWEYCFIYEQELLVKKFMVGWAYYFYKSFLIYTFHNKCYLLQTTLMP